MWHREKSLASCEGGTLTFSSGERHSVFTKIDHKLLKDKWMRTVDSLQRCSFSTSVQHSCQSSYWYNTYFLNEWSWPFYINQLDSFATVITAKWIQCAIEFDSFASFPTFELSFWVCEHKTDTITNDQWYFPGIMRHVTRLVKGSKSWNLLKSWHVYRKLMRYLGVCFFKKESTVNSLPLQEITLAAHIFPLENFFGESMLPMYLKYLVRTKPLQSFAQYFL